MKFFVSFHLFNLNILVLVILKKGLSYMGGLMYLNCYRMLVYEYVDNGNLEQWIHGDVGPCSPLTWEIRMNIILGTAKGYVLVE